jgi:hypothetical protein
MFESAASGKVPGIPGIIIPSALTPTALLSVTAEILDAKAEAFQTTLSRYYASGAHKEGDDDDDDDKESSAAKSSEEAGGEVVASVRGLPKITRHNLSDFLQVRRKKYIFIFIFYFS